MTPLRADVRSVRHGTSTELELQLPTELEVPTVYVRECVSVDALAWRS